MTTAGRGRSPAWSALTCRAGPADALAPRDLSPLSRRALTLYSATCLPLVVAITTIGLDDDVLGKGEAAALVGAAMVSVLVFPLLGLRMRAKEGGDKPRRVGSAEEAETW